MTPAKAAGVAVAVVLLACGLFLLLAGNGVIGSHGDTSHGWAGFGAALTGLSVALAYVVLAPRRR